MQRQFQAPMHLSPEETSGFPWLLGPLCLIGLAVELYISIATAGPAFTEFASMAAFP